MLGDLFLMVPHSYSLLLITGMCVDVCVHARVYRAQREAFH